MKNAITNAMTVQMISFVWGRIGFLAVTFVVAPTSSGITRTS